MWWTACLAVVPFVDVLRELVPVYEGALRAVPVARLVLDLEGERARVLATRTRNQIPPSQTIERERARVYEGFLL